MDLVYLQEQNLELMPPYVRQLPVGMRQEGLVTFSILSAAVLATNDLETCFFEHFVKG